MGADKLKTVGFEEIQCIKRFVVCDRKQIISSFVTEIYDDSFFFMRTYHEVKYDTKLQTVFLSSFLYSSIESLVLPINIQKLYFENITIIWQKEQSIFHYDNKFIVGKTNLDRDEFVYKSIIYKRKLNRMYFHVLK